jgi:hypothetical protein
MGQRLTMEASICSGITRMAVAEKYPDQGAWNGNTSTTQARLTPSASKEQKMSGKVCALERIVSWQQSYFGTNYDPES